MLTIFSATLQVGKKLEIEKIGENQTKRSVDMECRKEFAHKYEIHVCFTSPVSDISLYNRLRFGLPASTWFPRPLGIVLWSVLHVLLIVGRSALELLAALSLKLLAILILATKMLILVLYCTLFIAAALYFVMWILYGSLRIIGLGLCGPWLIPKTWSHSISRCLDDLKTSLTSQLQDSSQEVSYFKTVVKWIYISS